MLRFIRNRAQSIFIQAIVVVIVLVFVFWGVGTNLTGDRNVVAKVNNAEIPLDEYHRAYDQAVEGYQQQFGGQVPPGFLDGINLRGQIVNQLIQTELLRQGAREMGVMVDETAIRQRVHSMEVFLEDGSFSLDLYEAILSQNRLSPLSFEAGIREDMLLALVAEGVSSFAFLPATELEKWLSFFGEEIQIAALSIASPDFEDAVVVRDEAVAAWFEQHKMNYASEQKISLKYLFFPFVDDLDQVQVTDEELEKLFAEKKDEFTTPEQRHARHILIKVNEDDDPETVKSRKKQAEEILGMAIAGDDFAELAIRYSEGPSKDKGGDLGFFSKGQMVTPFDEAVFSMDAGEVRGPVQTSFGFHIIKLEEVRVAATRSFAEVRDELTDILRKGEVRGITFKRGVAAYEEIMRAGSLDNYREQGGKEVVVTDFFSRSEPPAGITADQGFLSAAFRLGRGELSSLVELGKGYGIIFVQDIKPPQIPDLASVREQVIFDYRREKAVELAREAAGTDLLIAREAGMLQGESVREMDYIKRSSPRAVNLPGQVIDAAFDLSPGQRFPDQPVEIANMFYIYEVRDRRLNQDPFTDTEKEQLRYQLLETKRNRIIDNWLAGLQAEAKIWINEQVLN
jgi:peptidyl-prolyl cis-trans isomerase D